ncbi:MAG: glycosyltransferase family 1 protein [Candidatus Omnitrophota bacterium]|jgi:glycosyltransferase involved in cell wall biosynthesis|nr:MAG: glycosyltransferase family 1 protein [Candidatus Omnitrophota bacterium]
MKLLFILPRGNMASTRLRALQYIIPLKQCGIHVDTVIAPKDSSEKMNFFRRIRQYDVVFIQKKLFQPWEITLIRPLSRFLIYDMDDAVMYKNRGNVQGKHPVRERKFKSTVKRADLIIVGNRYLKEQVFSFNSSVEILPTPVDLSRYHPKIHQGKDRLTIGWIGSRSTLGYLENLKDVFEQIGRRFSFVELKIVADAFFECQNMNIVKSHWNHDTEIEDLQSFDIGVMPLPDDRWTRGKCGFKLMQYLSVGIPAVCSPVGMNREIVRHGENGFWASNHDEWIEYLIRLIENQEIRRKFGVVGMETVRKNYSLEVNVKRLIRILNRYGCM